MICKKCGFESSIDFEVCSICNNNCSSECSLKLKSSRINDNGKTFILVNILLIAGFNILYLLLMGKALFSPWGDIGYIIYGVILLGAIELGVNIYLYIQHKANAFLIVFVTVFSLLIFIFLTSEIRNSYYLRQLF